jgi:hypothetical protein
MENNVCYWVKFQIFIIWKLKFHNCSDMLNLQWSQGDVFKLNILQIMELYFSNDEDLKLNSIIDIVRHCYILHE